jgi:hypothetical protein
MLKRILILLSVIVPVSCQKELNNTSIDLDTISDSVTLFAPGIISTRLYERDIAISPDGHEIMYTLGDYRQIRRCLVSIRKSENGWGKKVIPGFSGIYDDLEPFFSEDGNKLYFSSNRPVDHDSSRKDYNIWVAERSGDGWINVTPLPPLINSENDEFYPSVTTNKSIYFTSVRPNGIGSEDIFVSRCENGQYSIPEPLDTTINSSTYEFNAYVTPDESLIIFTSFGRKDDMGGGDLYYSTKDNSGKWKHAVHMGPDINSDKLDFCPFIDIPRRNFYFTSDRNAPLKYLIDNASIIEEFANQPLNGTGNIYKTTLNFRKDQTK